MSVAGAPAGASRTGRGSGPFWVRGPEVYGRMGNPDESGSRP